jgi:hypothetical protein
MSNYLFFRQKKNKINSGFFDIFVTNRSSAFDFTLNLIN